MATNTTKISQFSILYFLDITAKTSSLLSTLLLLLFFFFKKKTIFTLIFIQILTNYIWPSSISQLSKHGLIFLYLRYVN